jgi:hypothetical protein
MVRWLESWGRAQGWGTKGMATGFCLDGLFLFSPCYALHRASLMLLLASVLALPACLTAGVW